MKQKNRKTWKRNIVNFYNLDDEKKKAFKKLQNIEKVKYLYYVKCMRFLQSCEYTIFYALWEIWKKSKTSNA